MKKTTGDQNLIKKINKSLVLQTIMTKAPLSRAYISEITGLNKGTVSTLVGELIESRFVYEIGAGPSSGGRKPVMLLFNQAAGYAVGVDLGVNYVLTVLTDLFGTIVYEETSLLRDTSFNAAIDVLRHSISRAIGQAPASPYGVVGIGIGVPGITDEHGTLLFAPNLRWEHADLKSALANSFPIPIVIDNEANAGAAGELKYGAGKDASNLIYISAGIGIGTGIVMGGEIYRGVSGFSGEMGHITIETNGKRCRCGNRGCWELYASEHALIELAEARGLFEGESPERDRLSVMIQAADNGNAEALQLFNQVGEYLGVGIANMINTFNPQLIVIGSRLTLAEKWLINPIMRVMEQRTLSFHRKAVKIQFSALGLRSTVLGAASFAVSRFFTDASLNEHH